MPKPKIDETTAVRRIVLERLLTPVFQPIVDIRMRALLGYEALIRGFAGLCRR